MTKLATPTKLQINISYGHLIVLTTFLYAQFFPPILPSSQFYTPYFNSLHHLCITKFETCTKSWPTSEVSHSLKGRHNFLMPTHFSTETSHKCVQTPKSLSDHVCSGCISPYGQTLATFQMAVCLATFHL